MRADLRVAFAAAIAVATGATPAWAQSKPAVTPAPASTSNYTQRASRAIDMIVIHDMEGTAPGAISWFANPAAQASAHYCVHYDGHVWQCVQDHDIAWHAGNWNVNERSIGIEHSGFAAQSLYTQAEYDASARLVAYLCATYHIPIDRTHIIGHAEVPDPNNPGQYGGAGHHTDPGPHWDWNGYMALVRQYSNATPPTPDFASSATAQSATSLSMKSGDTATVWFEFKNTGAKTWNPSGASHLGTQSPQDRASPLFTSGNWIGANRPTPVDHATTPGAVGRYSFVVTAPSVAAKTTYHEVYRQVEDGVTWFGPNVAIDVTVEPAATPAPPPPPPPPTPGPPPAGKARIRVATDPFDAAVFVATSDDAPGVRLGTGGPASQPGSFEIEAGRVIVTAAREPYGARSVVVTVAVGQTKDVALNLRRPLASTFGAATDLPAVKTAGRTIPAIVDWNGDGKLDLIAGASDGTVTLLTGKGAGLDLAAGVALPIKVAGDAAPVAVDWDGDGVLDLLVGASDGSVTFFKGDGKGGLAAGVALKIPAAVGSAVPFACDIDDDGLLDLLVGMSDGTVRFHKRLANGDLDAGTALAGVQVTGPARPVARDLRQVGRLDLVVGGQSEARVFTNAGGSALPLFVDSGPLQAWTAGRPATIAGKALVAPALADVDGDGRLDLVVGDDTGARLYLASGLPGDVDDSKKVDARDLIRLQRAFGAARGTAPYHPASDLNEDGVVDSKDRDELVKQLGALPK